MVNVISRISTSLSGEYRWHQQWKDRDVGAMMVGVSYCCEGSVLHLCIPVSNLTLVLKRCLPVADNFEVLSISMMSFLTFDCWAFHVNNT
jgi:hypothetical protein